MNKFDTIHVEITNRCNAACPGCTRQDFETGETIDFFKNAPEVNWSLQDFKDILPPELLKDTWVFFGITIDEPLMNPNFLSIAQYVIESGGKIELDTNTGAGTEHTWSEFGKLVRDNPNRMHIKFSVDGYEDTNHIYRVNVKWNTVVRNMRAFAEHSQDATWMYLAFTHNEHDIPKAAALAEELGIRFIVRANTRNIQPWASTTSVKKDKKTVKTPIAITVNENSKFTHTDVTQIKNLAVQDKDNVSVAELDTITCMLLDKNEIVIDWSKRLWPCCWWQDVAISGDKKWMHHILAQYGNEWNRVDLSSIDEVLAHEYYTTVLSNEARYDTESKFFCGDKCFRHCGNNNRRQYQHFDKDGNQLKRRLNKPLMTT